MCVQGGGRRGDSRRKRERGREEWENGAQDLIEGKINKYDDKANCDKG